jgi:hypothetical protein
VFTPAQVEHECVDLAAERGRPVGRACHGHEAAEVGAHAGLLELAYGCARPNLPGDRGNHVIPARYGLRQRLKRAEGRSPPVRPRAVERLGGGGHLAGDLLDALENLKRKAPLQLGGGVLRLLGKLALLLLKSLELADGGPRRPQIGSSHRGVTPLQAPLDVSQPFPGGRERAWPLQR